MSTIAVFRDDVACRVRRRATSVGCVALCVALISCGSSGPGGPTSGDAVLGLTIEPATTALRVGETIALLARERMGSGALRTVPGATWSSDAPAIITIDDQGRATAKTVGRAVLTAAAGGRTASVSVQAVPDVTGHWSGEMRDTEVTRASGDGPFRYVQGLVRPFSFDLTQHQNVIGGTGVVDLVPGPVNGSIDSERAVTISGTFANAEGFRAEVSEWTGQLESSGTRLTGRFTVTQRFTNAWGPQVIVMHCDIVSLTRGSAP